MPTIFGSVLYGGRAYGDSSIIVDFTGGKVYFLYRARRWDTTPTRFLNDTELTAVAATATDPLGNPVTVTQQPAYIAAVEAYVGHIALENVPDSGLSIRLTGTVAAGLPAEWAPRKRLDFNPTVTTLSDGDVEFEEPMDP